MLGTRGYVIDKTSTAHTSGSTCEATSGWSCGLWIVWSAHYKNMAMAMARQYRDVRWDNVAGYVL